VGHSGGGELDVDGRLEPRIPVSPPPAATDVDTVRPPRNSNWRRSGPLVAFIPDLCLAGALDEAGAPRLRWATIVAAALAGFVDAQVRCVSSAAAGGWCAVS
jgi:hypothetical protein